MNRRYPRFPHPGSSCARIGAFLACFLSLSVFPWILQAATFRVTPVSPDETSKWTRHAPGLRTPLCGSVEADSSLFEVCLEADTFEFGEEIRFEYRVTNNGALPHTYVTPTLCVEHFGVSVAGCESPFECTFFWDSVDGCFQLPSSFSLDPGETKSFERFWSMHLDEGYPLAPGDYQLWGGLYGYGETGAESYASVSFQVVPYGPAPIQDALSLASAGDTVLVAAGTYQETIVFGGSESGVTLLSESGPDLTSLDGGQRGSAVYFHSTSNQTVIQGFTITNGRGGCAANPGCDGAAVGGGISVVQNGSVQILENWIRDNTSVSSGAGLSLAGAGAVTIEDNVFLHNVALENGGAIWRKSSSAVTIDNNTFFGNEAGNSGGAISVASGGTVNFRFNVFSENSAGFQGGGVSCGGSVAEFCNLFWMNSPDEFAGCSSSQSTVADPLFCSPPMERFGLREGSPCLPEHSACGSLIGAFGLDCDVSSVPETLPVPEDGAVPSGITGAGTLAVSPNPSSGVCTFRYSLRNGRQTQVGEPRASQLRLAIYDIAGRRVREFQVAGDSGTLQWDGNSDAGRRVPAGLYWGRLHLAGTTAATCPLLRVE